MTTQLWQYRVWKTDAEADHEFVSAASATEAAEKAAKSYDTEGGDGYDEGPTFWMVEHGQTWRIEVCASLKVVYQGKVCRTVTVCDACLQASCWQGEFYCDDYKTAGTVEKTVAELKALNLENAEYWEEGAGIDFRAGQQKAKP